MGDTFTQLSTHIVFSTYKREPNLKKSFRTDVFRYISGIINQRGHYSICIGGIEDHIHILVEANPKEGMSKLVQEIKTSSGKYINDQQWLPGKFKWQTGFSAFSVSRSHRKQTIDYIENQEEHHKNMTFEDEYRSFLKKHGINFKDEYLF
jgi:REP element-mobilizing transposase RayT